MFFFSPLPTASVGEGKGLVNVHTSFRSIPHESWGTILSRVLLMERGLFTSG